MSERLQSVDVLAHGTTHAGREYLRSHLRQLSLGEMKQVKNDLHRFLAKVETNSEHSKCCFLTLRIVDDQLKSKISGKSFP